MAAIYYPEGFFETTLSADLTTSATTISLTAVPARVTSGYMIIEPASSTKREVVHFTSVGASSVTAADDTTDSGDATGRGCLGSITVGANTAHDQGVTVIIAASEKYWKRMYDALSNVVVASTGALDTTKVVDLTTAQTLTNKRLTSPKLNENVALTSTSTELNALDGQTGAWTSTSPTTANLTKGSGSLTLKYIKIGKMVTILFEFTLAADSAVGTSPTFTLPFAAPTGTTKTAIFNAFLFDSGTAYYRGLAINESNTTVCPIFVDKTDGTYSTVQTNLTASIPHTWAENDKILVYGTYEAA